MTSRKPLVALLSGAGVSTDSGIPDYRGPQGLWRRDPEAEKLVTTTVHERSERTAPGVADAAGQPTWQARPNAAHRAVAGLERAGVPVRVITQNVDGLHQAAGLTPRKVLELHGSSARWSAPVPRAGADAGGAGAGRRGRGRPDCRRAAGF